MQAPERLLPCAVLSASPQDHLSHRSCTALLLLPALPEEQQLAASSAASSVTSSFSVTMNATEQHFSRTYESNGETFGGKTGKCTLCGEQVCADGGGLGWVQQWRQDGSAACKQPPNAPNQLQPSIMAASSQSVIP